MKSNFACRLCWKEFFSPKYITKSRTINVQGFGSRISRELMNGYYLYLKKKSSTCVYVRVIASVCRNRWTFSGDKIINPNISKSQIILCQKLFFLSLTYALKLAPRHFYRAIYGVEKWIEMIFFTSIGFVYVLPSFYGKRDLRERTS